MAQYKFTEYFEQEVLRKRTYIKKEWCIFVLEHSVRSEPQEPIGTVFGLRSRNLAAAT